MSVTGRQLLAGDVAVEFEERKVDEVFRDLDRCGLPGVAVGIAVGGTSVYRKGFGVASMELPLALSATMRMRVGSVSKHFTALAYMLLCEQGKAGIDDPLRKCFPEFNPVTHNVTMRQLMGHTGGLRSACDIRFMFGGFEGRQVKSSEALALYRDIEDADSAPGATWMYNNGGYMIVSAVIEKITGRPLEEALQQYIFSPAGMYDTLMRRWDTDFVPNSATPHTLAPTGRYEKRYWGIDFSGAGSVVSTVDDLLRWMAHMDKPIVGTGATWEIMRAPHALTNGTSTGYGLGLMSARYRGVDTLGHSGGWLGGNAQMLKLPGVGVDIVVISNRADVFTPVLVNQVIDVTIAGLEPVGATRRPRSKTEGFSVLRISPEPEGLRGASCPKG